MSEQHVSAIAEIEALPTGQWVRDASGSNACLMITHMGVAQRMWGYKRNGGTKGFMVYHLALDLIPLPLHLADVDTDACEHPHANECGQCECCGLVGVTEAEPLFFDAEGMATFRAVAEHNRRIGGDR